MSPFPHRPLLCSPPPSATPHLHHIVIHVHGFAMLMCLYVLRLISSSLPTPTADLCSEICPSASLFHVSTPLVLFCLPIYFVHLIPHEWDEAMEFNDHLPEEQAEANRHLWERKGRQPWVLRVAEDCSPRWHFLSQRVQGEVLIHCHVRDGASHQRPRGPISPWPIICDLR